MTKTEKNIEQWFLWLSEKIKILKQLDDSVKRTILFAIIDAIRASLYSGNFDNKNKYISMIDDLAKWKYKNFVSLPYLFAFLKLKEHKCHECSDKKNRDRLISEVEKRLKLWPRNSHVPASADAELPDLNNKCAEGKCNPLESCRYSQLLYMMRNSHVHEFRAVCGGGSFMSETEEPFYFFLTYHNGLNDFLATENNDYIFKAVFPIEDGFEAPDFQVPTEQLSQLADTCLIKAKTKMESEAIDPFENLQSGVTILLPTHVFD